MALDYLLTHRKANACAGIFFPGVQALEDLENPAQMLRSDTDTVVADRKNPLAVSAPCLQCARARAVASGILWRC